MENLGKFLKHDAFWFLEFQYQPRGKFVEFFFKTIF